MVTFLITSFLLLAGITYAVYLWQRPRSNRETEALLPPPPQRTIGLFGERYLKEQLPPGELSSVEIISAEEQQALLERAAAGDRETLREAHAPGRTALYDEVMNRLIERADSDKALLSLVSYVVRSDANLPVNNRLAEKFIESWKRAPDRNSTAKMLHVAALASDAQLYQGAIESAYEFWRTRRLTGISADELRQLIESEFWILAADARSSGAGFVLKRKLAQIRRQLVAASDS